MIKYWLSLFIVLLLSNGIYASTEKTFQNGILKFKAGDFEAASTSFNQVAKKKWTKDIGQMSLVANIEIACAKKDYETASKKISRFLTYFPDSRYKERVYLIKAFIASNNGDFYGAAETFGLILKTTNDKIQYARAQNSMLEILKSDVLSENEMMLWIDKYQVDNKIMSNLMIKVAEKALAKKAYKRARYYALRLKTEGIDGGYFLSRVEKVLSAADQVTGGKATLLVMAPLTGSFAQFGNEVIQGILVAEEEIKTADKIEIKFVDTESDPVTAVEKAKQIFKRDSIVGVVGPLLSSTATSVAVWLSEAYPKTPMITPTANTEGIATLGKNIFQLNISPGALANHIANYAMTCLDIDEFGVFTPNSEYGRISGSNFMQTVEEAGRSIILNESYVEGGKDYQTQFNIIREKGYALKNKRHLIRVGAKDINYTKNKDKREFLADSVITFAGFFLPASDPVDAAMLASQYSYNKLDGILLGTGGWFGATTIKDGRNSVQNSFFATAFMETSERKEFQKFKKLFVRKWKLNPGDDKVSGLSYDAASMLLSPLKLDKSGLELIDAITQEKFSGVYNDVVWDKKSGKNINYNIVRINKGKFHQSDECPSAEEVKKIKYRPDPPKKKK